MTLDMQTLALILIAEAFTAVGVYAAIRSDLREVMVRVSLIEKRLENPYERYPKTK